MCELVEVIIWLVAYDFVHMLCEVCFNMQQQVGPISLYRGTRPLGQRDSFGWSYCTTIIRSFISIIYTDELTELGKYRKRNCSVFETAVALSSIMQGDAWVAICGRDRSAILSVCHRGQT